MGCIAIVCVLLFWFCYFGILAKLGGAVVELVFGFRRSRVRYLSPPFSPVILRPSQTLSEAKRQTLAVFESKAFRFLGFGGWYGSCYDQHDLKG
jgi:hypothetical protein